MDERESNLLLNTSATTGLMPNAPIPGMPIPMPAIPPSPAMPAQSADMQLHFSTYDFGMVDMSSYEIRACALCSLFQRSHHVHALLQGETHAS